MQQFPFVRETGETGQAGLFRDFPADGDQIAACNPVSRIREEAGEGGVVGEQEQPTGGLIQSSNSVERLQFFWKHIVNRFPALLILTRRHHAFRFVKEDKSLRAWLNRLAVEGDAVARPGNPGVGGPYDALVHGNASGANPFLRDASAGQSQF